MKLEPLLTSEDVARALSINIETVRRMTRRGSLPSVLIGRVRRYTADDVQAIIKKSRKIEVFTQKSSQI